jgi:hypothetical protein
MGLEAQIRRQPQGGCMRARCWLRGAFAVLVLAAPALSADDLDPNRTRLLFAPTARPLDRGEGYFSDTELLFPGVAYGLTDNLSIGGGVSIVPGIGLDRQLFYVSPKLGFDLGRNASVAVGGLWAKPGQEEEALVVGYGVGTLGPVDRSLSAGFGLMHITGDDDSVPVLMLGGNVTVARHVALVAESWIDVQDPDVGRQPIGIAARFFGDKLSADVGVVIVGEVIDEGFPLPWLSVTYHFGGRKSAGARAARMPLPHSPSLRRK